jgi:hypothetical protein
MGRKRKPKEKPVKALLLGAGVRFGDVAARAGVCYSMVVKVVAGDRVSAPVMRAVRQLVDEATARRAARSAT